MIQIKNLHASIEGKEILKGVTLDIRKDEIHALMGPNGSGKSTLSSVIMGHPDFEVTEGDIVVDGESIMDLSADERSKLGIFLSFQYPNAIPGVTVSHFLRAALNAHRSDDEKLSVVEANKLIMTALETLSMDKAFLQRYVNDGFSGGEKKRLEILQLFLLQPKLAVLDETDSGTDVDALKIISSGVKQARSVAPMGVLLITHYERILHLLKPNRISIMVDGKIVDTGDASLAQAIEKDGYTKYLD